MELKPGDIIKYSDGKLDYIMLDANGDTAINACNKSWIERGLRLFGQELYPCYTIDMQDAEVVGHYGSGTLDDGMTWYDANKEAYAG